MSNIRIAPLKIPIGFTFSKKEEDIEVLSIDDDGKKYECKVVIGFHCHGCCEMSMNSNKTILSFFCTNVSDDTICLQPYKSDCVLTEIKNLSGQGN